MTRQASLRGSAPAFMAGIALAIGTQVGTGLLLYGGPGLLQALSVILAAATVSLATGLAWGGRVSVEDARRAWFLLLLAFAGAAVFSGGWEIFRGFGGRAVTQGIGLALLIALPLHLGGRLLAQLASPGSGTNAPGPPALVGGAVGLLILGHVFFPALSPTAVLLLCVVAVSGGALTHGWVLDEVVRDSSLDIGEPRLVVRRSRRVRPPLDVLTVEEGAAVRLVRRGDGGPLLPLDVGLEADLLPSLPPPERVLAIGWRAVPAAARVVPPGTTVTIVHPLPDGIRALLGSLSGPGRPAGDVNIVEGTPGGVDLQVDCSSADWILVDAAELGESDGSAWSRLRGLLCPGGTLIVVGATETIEPAGADQRAGGNGLLGPLQAGARHFGSAAAYVGPAAGWVGPAEPRLENGWGGERADAPSAAGREGLLVFASEAGRTWPDRAGPLLLVLPGQD